VKMLAANFLDSVEAHRLHNQKMSGVVAVSCVSKCTWINAEIGRGMVLRIRLAVVLIMVVKVKGKVIPLQVRCGREGG